MKSTCTSFASESDHSSLTVGYDYDFQNRLTNEIIYSWDAAAGDFTHEVSSFDYLYENQTLVAIIDHQTGYLLQRSTWDPRHSGEAGGLLGITNFADDSSQNATGVYIPFYDGAGNTMGLVDRATGNVVARYSYTTYGECTTSGTSGLDPFLFQKQYHDAVTGFYRLGGGVWYSPDLGRMFQRAGGDEYPYVFEGNDPINVNISTVSDRTAAAQMAEFRLNNAMRYMFTQDPRRDKRMYAAAFVQAKALGISQENFEAYINDLTGMKYGQMLGQAVADEDHALAALDELQHRYDGWHNAIPIVGSYVNLWIANSHDDNGMAAMSTGFLMLDFFTLGSSSVATQSLEISARFALEESLMTTARLALRTAGRELLANAAGLFTERAMQISLLKTMGAWALPGGIIGGIQGYRNGGGIKGAVWGAVQGASEAALMGMGNWFFNPSCFTEKAETILGIPAEESEGSPSVEKQGGVLTSAEPPVMREVSRNVKDVREGDLLASVDEFNPGGPVVYRKVEAVHRNIAFELHILKLQDSSGIEHEICSTEGHVVYIVEKDWIRCHVVKVGDRFIERNGGMSTVIDIRHEVHPEGIAVYNFSVEGTHTYFVRETGSDAEAVWVHNRCNPLRSKMEKAGSWGKAGEDAAHVVPVGVFSRRIKDVRDAIVDAKAILSSHGIDLDSLPNGFRAVTGHLGTHSNTYLLKMSERLVSAGSRGRVSVLRELQKLKFDILNGKFQ